MNAVKLVTLYASEQLREETYAAVWDRAPLGLWSADDPDKSLTIESATHRMHGSKRFASGLVSCTAPSYR